MSEQPEISDELKVKYFDVIYEFGILTNSGNSPVESPAHPYRIQLQFRGADGILSRCTAYGADVIEVCRRSVEWLEPRGWKGHSQLLLEGLTNFAHAVVNTVAQGTQGRGIEIIE